MNFDVKKIKSYRRVVLAAVGFGMGIVVTTTLYSTSWPLKTEMEIIFSETAQGESPPESMAPSAIHQWHLRDRSRYDFSQEESVINDHHLGKTYHVQWNHKKVREIEDTSQPRSSGSPPALVPDGEFACFEPATKDLCWRFTFKDGDNKFQVYVSKAYGPLERAALRVQHSESEDFLLAIQKHDPKHLVRRLDVLSPKTLKVVKITQEKERKIYWAGWLYQLGWTQKLPNKFQWPDNFILNRQVNDLHQLPSEVRESILKQQGVQILEAK